jgi:hypothetical protein
VWSIDPKTRDTPHDPAVLDTALLLGTRVAEPILAAVAARPHQQTAHMIASDPIRTLHHSCKPGAVHIWIVCFRRR